MEVTVKAAGWRYRLKSTGRFVPVERGGKVDLDLVMTEDVERGRRHGVFDDPPGMDGAPVDSGGAPFDKGIGALAEWLEAAKLNVDRTVRLANGDADRARMLIDAEPAATGGKPRASVLKALGQVIVRAEETGDHDESTAAGDGDEDEPDADGAGDDDDEESDA